MRSHAGGGARFCAPTLYAARARALVEELGGEVLASNAEVAERADVVMLCHKATQLGEVAAQVAPHARAVASILASVSLPDLKQHYPGLPVYRVMPSLPVEVRRGALVLAADEPQDPQLDSQLLELFEELGLVVVLEDSLLDVATGLMSCAPAYVALIVESQVDAGVRRGVPARQAAELVVQALSGTADLLRSRGYDTLAVRREVASPGGLTARGLDALERGGVRSAFSDAMDAALGQDRR